MTATPDWTAFEKYLRCMMSREQIPGVAAGLSVNGNVVYARGFGVQDLETGRPVDEHTVFGIASVSKSFAALAVMQLVDEGRVCPQAPVAQYLPEFTMRAAEDGSKIRVHHCLSHTTGCPPLRRAQGEFEEFSQHIEYLANYDTVMLGRPGEYMSYCNDTFMLSGAITERVGGRRFREHVRERVFEPLGMHRTTYDIADLARWDNVTRLYVLNKEKTGHETRAWPALGTYHVGGGIRSTVIDLLKYGDMYCAGGRGADGRQVVSEAGVLRMRAPIHPVGEGSYYCYALQITPAYHGVSLVEHGGSLPGVASRFGYVPERAISAVVLTNLSGAPADQIWTALVNTALGLPLGGPRFAPAPTFPVSEDRLQLLIGLYATDEGLSVRVSLAEGSLAAEFEGQSYPLRMTGPDAAVYMMQGAEKPVSWYVRDNQPAWAIRTGVRIARRAKE